MNRRTHQQEQERRTQEQERRTQERNEVRAKIVALADRFGEFEIGTLPTEVNRRDVVRALNNKLNGAGSLLEYFEVFNPNYHDSTLSVRVRREVPVDINASSWHEKLEQFDGAGFKTSLMASFAVACEVEGLRLKVKDLEHQLEKEREKERNRQYSPFHPAAMMIRGGYWGG